MVMKMADDRAPFTPEQDRMMRVTASTMDLVTVAICEECKRYMKSSEVASHFERTRHTTYNQKLVPRSKSAALLASE